MELTPEQKQRLRDSIDKVMRERKYSWTAEGPDGRVFEWNTFGIDGDNSLVAEVLVTMDVEPLKLGYYKILDSDIKNPYSVRLALEMVKVPETNVRL